MSSTLFYTVTVWRDDSAVVLEARSGVNLRKLLLSAGLSPYAPFTQRVNCGGRGLCATCGVWPEPEPPARHWHDRLAAQFDYPRLSCQIAVESDLTVRLLTKKRIWGERRIQA